MTFATSRHPRFTTALLAGVAAVLAVALATPRAQPPVPSTPETPFKLATFRAAGQSRLGLVLGSRVLDIAAANATLVEKAGVPAMTMPLEMRQLIEEYATVAPRLYQIANYFRTGDGPFAYDVSAVTIEAPIKYPWNLLAAAANYRAHAEGMGAAGAGGGEPGESRGRRGGFNASALDAIDPDRDAPIFFAKSPRSCIIDPGEPYYIPEGRDRIDWEAELAIIIGREAYMVPRDRVRDYVFGYSIVYDLSDRGGRRRDATMFPGPNWFDGKSTDRGAPFGPYIVPKEFLPDPYNRRISTKVNGVVKQDGSTRDLIWKEHHMISYVTSILTLYPGDVIATGTPSGTGAERGEFLEPGDVVEIEIEGIGTLQTPMKAASERPATGS